MNRMFDAQGVTWVLTDDGWLVSKDEIKKERSVSVQRHPCRKGLGKGSSRWTGEFEWIDGSIGLIQRADGTVSCSFVSSMLDRVVGTYGSSKTEALEKLEKLVRERQEEQ